MDAGTRLVLDLIAKANRPELWTLDAKAAAGRLTRSPRAASTNPKRSPG